MKQAGAHQYSRKRFLRVALSAFLGTATLGIDGCSLSGPLPNEYLLSAMPAATATTVRQTGLPVVELKRVQLPDYLDTTDILQRRGIQLIPSPTGRWGERLSVGMSRALTASLAARLPRMVVTATPPVERPSWQILVDVADFESRADKQVVLVARWSVADGASRHIIVAEQTSLVEPVAGTDDSALVTAMSHAVQNLADQIAAGIDASHSQAERAPAAPSKCGR